MQKTIMIVDDEAPIRKLFARTLENADTRTVAAASGAEALALIREDRPDLVLLDLNMPALDGAETLREIRKLDQHLPVCIITSFADAFFDKLKSLREAGVVFEVIHKPVDKEQLRALVNAVLQQPVAESGGEGT